MGLKKVNTTFKGLSLLLILSMIISPHWYIDENDYSKVESLKNNPQDTTDEFDLVDSPKKKDTTRIKRFKKTKRVFSEYNKNVSDETVETFLDVCQFYNLIKDEHHFNYYIGQICLESGAKQYSEGGEIIKSSGNAIGISQIVPTTAFFYLKHYIPPEDKKELKKKGVNTDFVENHELTVIKVNEDSVFKYVSGKARKKTVDWLKNEKNNLYLWGYIMKRNLNRFNMFSALVAYNKGPYYLTRVENSSEFIYVKKIRYIVYNKIKGGNNIAMN